MSIARIVDELMMMMLTVFVCIGVLGCGLGIMMKMMMDRNLMWMIASSEGRTTNSRRYLTVDVVAVCRRRQWRRRLHGNEIHGVKDGGGGSPGTVKISID